MSGIEAMGNNEFNACDTEADMPGAEIDLTFGPMRRDDYNHMNPGDGLADELGELPMPVRWQHVVVSEREFPEEQADVVTPHQQLENVYRSCAESRDCSDQETHRLGLEAAATIMGDADFDPEQLVRAGEQLLEGQYFDDTSFLRDPIGSLVFAGVTGRHLDAASAGPRCVAYEEKYVTDPIVDALTLGLPDNEEQAAKAERLSLRSKYITEKAKEHGLINRMLAYPVQRAMAEDTDLQAIQARLAAERGQPYVPDTMPNIVPFVSDDPDWAAFREQYSLSDAAAFVMGGDVYVSQALARAYVDGTAMYSPQMVATARQIMRHERVHTLVPLDDVRYAGLPYFGAAMRELIADSLTIPQYRDFDLTAAPEVATYEDIRSLAASFDEQDWLDIEGSLASNNTTRTVLALGKVAGLRHATSVLLCPSVIQAGRLQASQHRPFPPPMGVHNWIGGFTRLRNQIAHRAGKQPWS